MFENRRNLLKTAAGLGMGAMASAASRVESAPPRTGGPLDVLDVWKEWAPKATGKELPTGHFIVEERPDLLLEKLNRFLS